MPEISRRRTGEYLRKLFEILMKQPEGLPARDAVKATAEQLELTEWEAGHYEDGHWRFDKVLRWATVDCVKAAWLVKNAGRWSITDEGRKAYKSYADPEELYKRAVFLYNNWRKNKAAAGAAEPEEIDPGSGGKEVRLKFDQAEEDAWAEIEGYITSMPPYEFQELVASLLRAMGYHVGWVAPPGKDGGVDVLAFNDPLGTRPPRIKVQVKRQDSKVSVDGLRSFMAVLGAEDVGIFVNAGGFTKDADDEARVQQVRRVTLIDLERLVELWKEHYPRLDEAARRRLPLQPIYFLAPEV